MSKIKCSLCGNETGKLKQIKLGDGSIVCDKCYWSAGFGTVPSPQETTLEKLIYDIEINKIKEHEKQEEDQRRIRLESQRTLQPENQQPIITHVTRTAGGVEFFDKEQMLSLKVKTGLLAKADKVIRYDQIISYELVEDGETAYKGGLGMAAVGALTFGTAGAVVGSVVGKKKQRRTCTTLCVRIVLRNDSTSVISIPFIIASTRVGGFMYNVQKQGAEELIAALAISVDMVEQARAAASEENARAAAQDACRLAAPSPADEIRKYKELLDEGIISEEEFAAKKKQLLGI